MTTLEDLSNRLRRTMERRKEGGLDQTRRSIPVNQLPIYYGTLESMVIKPADLKLFDYHTLPLINLITEIANELGMERVEGEEGVIAWDVRDRRLPTPLGDPQIVAHYKDPTLVTGHIPRASYRRQKSNSDRNYGEEQTYTIKDA